MNKDIEELLHAIEEILWSRDSLGYIDETSIGELITQYRLENAEPTGDCCG